MNEKLIKFLNRRIESPTSAHDYLILDKLVELRNKLVEEDEKIACN